MAAYIVAVALLLARAGSDQTSDDYGESCTAPKIEAMEALGRDSAHSFIQVSKTHAVNGKRGLEDEGYSLAYNQSYGFIDEPPEKWAMRKKIHLAQLEREKNNYHLFDEAAGRVWFQYHQEPSFHCEFMARIGNVGDGGKWMCDPHLIAQRIQSGKPCLVYSVGSRGQFDFEEAVQKEISPDCEIHIFDPSPDYKATTPKNMFYHAYPLGVPGQEIDGVPAKSLSQVAQELGHVGRRLDMFKIDCEGCEWETFRDWMSSGLDMQQIMVELHWRANATRAQEYFDTLREHGYVVFSKEPNTEGCGGDCIEYSFLKLDPSFSKPDAV